MAIRGYAHIDSSTGRIVNAEMPSSPTFESILLSNGLSVSHGIISLTGGIDATATGTTALKVLGASTGALVTHIIFNLSNVNSIAGALIVGVGTNGTQDNIMAATTLTGLVSNDQTYALPLLGLSALAAPTETITLGIDTAFTGTSATLEVVLIGALI